MNRRGILAALVGMLAGVRGTTNAQMRFVSSEPAPYRIDLSGLTELRVTSGKETIALTRDDIMKALRHG